MSVKSGIELVLLKSPHHEKRNIRECVRVLGLRRIRSRVICENTPVVRGLIRKAIHLLQVRLMSKGAGL